MLRPWFTTRYLEKGPIVTSLCCLKSLSPLCRCLLLGGNMAIMNVFRLHSLVSLLSLSCIAEVIPRYNVIVGRKGKNFYLDSDLTCYDILNL
jgi:hypothetical protein